MTSMYRIVVKVGDDTYAVRSMLRVEPHVGDTIRYGERLEFTVTHRTISVAAGPAADLRVVPYALGGRLVEFTYRELEPVDVDAAIVAELEALNFTRQHTQREE